MAEPASGVLAPSSEALDKMGGLPAHLLDAANALQQQEEEHEQEGDDNKYHDYIIMIINIIINIIIYL